MTDILKVIKPFFVMEAGDTFELSEDGENYVSRYNVEHSGNSDENDILISKYESEYTISKSYAADLIKEGYLEEVAPVRSNNYAKRDDFINVFDEINDLMTEYQKELDNIDGDMSDAPACMKIERQTVLSNLITVLEHLSSLKK